LIGEVETGTEVSPKPNTRLDVEVTMPQTFNGEAEKVLEFLTAYKLFIRMRMREAVVEE